MVSKHINDPFCNVVLLPTHQSFLDLWILGMINVEQKLPYPFNYGEQSLVKLAIADIILRKSGTFKLSPSHEKDELFKAVLNGYISSILHND